MREANQLTTTAKRTRYVPLVWAVVPGLFAGARSTVPHTAVPKLRPRSAECAEQVPDVSLPLCARADDIEAERVVDRDHGRVGERVVRLHAYSLWPLVPDPFEHRRLHPFSEPQPAMRRVDAGVLLPDGRVIPRLEG